MLLLYTADDTTSPVSILQKKALSKIKCIYKVKTNKSSQECLTCQVTDVSLGLQAQNWPYICKPIGLQKSRAIHYCSI